MIAKKEYMGAHLCGNIRLIYLKVFFGNKFMFMLGFGLNSWEVTCYIPLHLLDVEGHNFYEVYDLMVQFKYFGFYFGSILIILSVHIVDHVVKINTVKNMIIEYKLIYV